MILANQDHDPGLGRSIAGVRGAAEGGGRWRGSSPSRRATTPPIRGGRSAPRPSPGAHGPGGRRRLLPVPGGERRRAAGPLARQGRRRSGLPPGAGHRAGGLRAALRPASSIPRDPAGQTRLGRAPSGSARLRRSTRRCWRAGAGGDRRAPRPVTDRGEGPGPDAGPVLGRDVQRVEVDLVVPRQRMANAAKAAASRGPGSGRLLGAGRRGCLGRVQEGNAAALDYLQREAG